MVQYAPSVWHIYPIDSDKVHGFGVSLEELETFSKAQEEGLAPLIFFSFDYLCL